MKAFKFMQKSNRNNYNTWSRDTKPKVVVSNLQTYEVFSLFYTEDHSDNLFSHHEGIATLNESVKDYIIFYEDFITDNPELLEKYISETQKRIGWTGNTVKEYVSMLTQLGLDTDPLRYGINVPSD